MKTLQVREVSLYINGEYVPSGDGKTFPLTNPATQETIAYVSEATVEDADRAVLAARKAFEEGPWRTMPLKERCSKLRRLTISNERRDCPLGVTGRRQTVQIGAREGDSPRGAKHPLFCGFC